MLVALLGGSTICLAPFGPEVGEPAVLPVSNSGSQIPSAAWQELYETGLKEEENGVAAKCEFFRCKVRDGIVGVK
ncbi:unnamed protein product [Linum trigynum]|uniref:Uncharacterized protein n=1 Tax=Linum trigynum TaxID=586398 RepID=A0AAV2CM39_9ROSI